MSGFRKNWEEVYIRERHCVLFVFTIVISTVFGDTLSNHALYPHDGHDLLKPIRNLITLLSLITAGMPAAFASGGAHPGTLPDVHDRSITELEQRLTEIETTLNQLAHYSLRSGTGSVGFRSHAHSDAQQTEWIQIDLTRESSIDQIIVVPSIWRNRKTGFETEGFPVAFRVLTGTAGDDQGNVIATFDRLDSHLPRIAPLLIPCQTTASWVRVEATELSRGAFFGDYNLQLAEILVFDGTEDLALGKPVSASSTGFNEADGRRREFLVDGFTPYLMDAGRGEQTIAFLSRSKLGDHPSITIDLGKPQVLDRIHLHPVDSSDTVPRLFPIGFALPHHIQVEGALLPDFTDALHLVDVRHESHYDVGPVIARVFPETPCRFVRITAKEPFISMEERRNESRMGFAEIELFSDGRNVALHKPATGQFLKHGPERHMKALTDGRNLYGSILPTRQWLEELAYRHDLEVERPRVEAELNRRYAQQNVLLRRFTWLAALLVISIAFILRIATLQRRRQSAQLRERFSADLHDELGANIHTIGLLSDISKKAIDSPEKLMGLLDRIRKFSERSGSAIRHCTNMLEADEHGLDVIEEMEQSAARMLIDLEYELDCSGEEFLQDLKPRQSVDLFLFYKECLSNILRHSGASHVSVHLIADSKKVCLTITDNGQGLDAGATVPASIRRRARLLGGRATTDQPPGGGTRITLSLNIKTGGRLT